MKRFADIVEEVKSLPLEEKKELQNILDKILADERHKEILQHYHQALEELKSGKLKFYSNPDDLLKMLNTD